MKTAAPTVETPPPKRKKNTARQLAEALLKWRQITTEDDRSLFAEGVEEARRRMNNEHLH
jgi:hypothetical protein